MTPLAAVAVALVVWSVGLIRAVRVRALVYSLPIPMSLVLANGKVHVDGTQIVGVLLLVAFFAATAVLHARLHWPAVPAVIVATLGYVAVAWALPHRLALLPCLAAVTALWLAGVLRWRTASAPAADRPPADRPWVLLLAKLAAVLAATFAVVWLAGFLAGFVVTFPYSGVLVAVELRRELEAFTRAFARTAIALVAFVAGFAAGQQHGTAAGLAAGWLAYGLCAAAVQWTRRH